VLGVAVLLATLVQGTVGLGFALVAAPVVTLVDADLMPGLLIWLGLVLPALTLARERVHTRWRGLGWALAGRVPGTALGVLVVSVVSATVLGVLVGVVVLAAVVVTAVVARLPERPSVLAGAGLVSGVTGTSVSIDGPPVALVLQHSGGSALRATMSAYFLGGAVLSLAGLALGGQLTRDQAVTAAALAPVVLVGFALSGPLRRHVDAGRTRVAVLSVCTVSALALLARTVVG
jgi:uncharacterized membrane protein YfcA